MAVDPREFWGANIYRNPVLEDSMIETAQSKLGVVLPAAYLSLLRIQNGGMTAGFSCKHDSDEILVDHLNGIVPSRRKPGRHNILDTELITQEWELPKQQVLLCGDGHTWISLDYRKSSEPNVVYIWSEDGSTESIADNFDDFLIRLELSA